MQKFRPGLIALGVATALAGNTALADNFNRISTFFNYWNNADRDAETVSEIVAVNSANDLLLYTDSPLNQLGFVSIADPALPMELVKFDLAGEPTSVAVQANAAAGRDYALIGVNTSTGYTTPDVNGELAVLDISSIPATLVATIPLGGQPDSVAVSPDGQFAAIVIENERDEEICVSGGPSNGSDDEDACEDDGGVFGGLPQTAFGNPAGTLLVLDISAANPAAWPAPASIDLTGLASYGAEDPEPEFVDINAANQAIVTMQENNHIVLVDLPTLTITDHFSAGTVDLNGIDNNEDGLISLTDNLTAVPREPDAVTWLPAANVAGGYAFATADEGDLFGGSRGWTVFNPNGGAVLAAAGTSFEELAVRIGHYPDDRSENKGSEPESVEYGQFGGVDYLFVGSERGSFVAVYILDADGVPSFSQVLPAPFGPEGLLAIPGRNLLVASGEEDDPEFGVRSTMQIYALQDAPATYPQLQSGNDASGKPIGWAAMSGMTTHPWDKSKLLAVWDSYYSTGQIFTIDTTTSPATIVDALPIVGGTGNYDPEGIVIAPDHTVWIASEGNASDARPNRLLQVDKWSGALIREVQLPQKIASCRADSEATGTLGSGFEGLTVVDEKLPGFHLPGRWSPYYLLVAQQRGWNYTTADCEKRDDDPYDTDDSEPGFTRIWSYDPRYDRWSHVSYELEDLPANASWVGLSEITRVPGGFIVIERDNRTGNFAQLKTLVYFTDQALADGVVRKYEKRSFDLLPSLLATHGLVSDKAEGVAIDGDGNLYVVTDNDGVEDWSGETWFMNLGPWKELFGLQHRPRHSHGKGFDFGHYFSLKQYLPWFSSLKFW